VNIDNLNKLIDHLKKVPRGAFSMADWIRSTNFIRGREQLYRDAANIVTAQEAAGPEGEHTCGTVACIAGHAALLAAADGSATSAVEQSLSTDHIAEEWLGINHAFGRRLFLPDYLPLRGRDEAIRVLERLRDTGKVRWNELPDGYGDSVEAYRAMVE
jgi:hypothetical protein